MEREGRRRKILHRQARQLVYKVFSYFKREADAGVPVHDVAKAQEPKTEVCDKRWKSANNYYGGQRRRNLWVSSLSLSLSASPAVVRVGHFRPTCKINIKIYCKGRGWDVSAQVYRA
jgi:hypothetical protein